MQLFFVKELHFVGRKHSIAIQIYTPEPAKGNALRYMQAILCGTKRILFFLLFFRACGGDSENFDKKDSNIRKKKKSTDKFLPHKHMYKFQTS